LSESGDHALPNAIHRIRWKNRTTNALADGLNDRAEVRLMTQAANIDIGGIPAAAHFNACAMLLERLGDLTGRLLSGSLEQEIARHAGKPWQGVVASAAGVESDT
jgi:hypothetical protein